MATEPEETSMTAEEYLALEEVSEVKHEYVAGHVYAMSGGTLAHDAVGNNVRALIRAHVRGSRCRLFGPDVILRVSPEVYYYPDALVVCDDAIDLSVREVRTPRLIVEVLSGSTEANDRGAKFMSYQTLDTFEEYLLVDARRRSVERFRRGERRLWIYQQYAPHASVSLETIGLTCAMADFYDGTGM